MRRVGPVILHGTLLGLLGGGAAYGVVMLAGYAVMVIAAATGLMPVPELTVSLVVFGVLMVALWGGIIVAGLNALLRQGRRTIGLVRRVADTSITTSAQLAAAATRAGIRDSVVEVPDDVPYAFTYGIWRPRVVVSTSLVTATTQPELVAVLRHENQHVRNRDPLKVLALRTWAAAFFLLPLVGSLLHRILDRQELKADRAAIRDCGTSPVAGALLKAAGEPATAPGAAVAGMGGPALLEARVAQLETGQSPGLRSALRPSKLLASLPGAALVAVYGVLLYQVCIATQRCCLS